MTRSNKCSQCGSSMHIRPNCPDKAKRKPYPSRIRPFIEPGDNMIRFVVEAPTVDGREPVLVVARKSEADARHYMQPGYTLACIVIDEQGRELTREVLP